MKKGIEAEVLIVIIIILVSFAIILFFIRYINPEPIINREICRDSVIMRNSLVVKEIEKATELRCKTEYYCLRGKGKCLTGYKKIQIKGARGGYDIEDMKLRIANAMYDCWWQMGEGRLSPFSKKMLQTFALEQTESKCFICSVISFDDKLAEEKLEIDLWSFLEKEKIPGTNKTYLQYFSEQEDVELPEDIKKGLWIYSKLRTDEKYVIYFFFFKADKYVDVLKKNGIVAAAGAGSLVIGSVGVKSIPFAGTALAKAGSAIVKSPHILAALAGVILGVMIAQPIIISKNMKWANIYCNYEDYENITEETKKGRGCYMLLLTKFDPKEIKLYCGDLEGIP